MTQDNNAEHYERLEIEPWEIMKADFTKEEWIGFLKGNIIKYVLREKGDNEKDAQKIQKYAKELEEAYSLQDEVRKNLGEEPSMDSKREFNLAENTTKLTPNKWYNACSFSKEKLELLLPIGTLVEVLVDHIVDIWDTTPPQTEKTKAGTVESIQKSRYTKIFIEEDEIAHYWFRIIEKQEEQCKALLVD